MSITMQMKRPGLRVEPAIVLLLSIVTCGIYYLIWMYRVSSEVQEALGEPDTSPALDVLLTVISCYLYSIFWDWKVAQKIARIQENCGIKSENNGILYLILNFVGLGMVTPLFIQQNLNDIWRNWD